MKTAIVISGHLRCWKTVFPNFKQHFIDRYNPDIFIHTWNDEAYWVPVEGPMGIKEHCPLIDEADVRAHYNPVDMVIENYADFEPTFNQRATKFPNFYHRPRNIISMFYKIGAGVHLLEKHTMKTGQTYDLVIRMRPDMVLHQAMPDFDPAKFYTLAHRNHMGGGTGDMFQIGNMTNIMKFSKIGMLLEGIYSKTDLLCPHVISSWFIENQIPLHEEFNINKTIQHTPKGQYQAV